MKKLISNRTLFLIFIGAFTCFLWFPLLPVIVPLVTLTLGLKWASTVLLSEPTKEQQGKLLYFPVTHTSQSQAEPTAWLSSASQPHPARAGSLPPSSKDVRNNKRQLRMRRQIVRAMNGLELRKSVHGI